MESEPKKSWREINIDSEFIGEKITKSSGYYEKEYRYIKIPTGYGYDGYVFLLAESIVGHLSELNLWWFSICDDMKIELFYDPELREPGKRYKRYKITGHELVETVFEAYERNFENECEEQLKAERIAKEKRDKANVGTVICGRYTGNIYGNEYNNYNYQKYLSAFFQSKSGTYSNHTYQKVQNVKRDFTIMEMTKYHFLRFEDIINAYISEYEMYKNMYDALTKHLELPKKIATDTDSIAEEQLFHCHASMDEIKKKLQERLEKLLSSVGQ